ncbi:MAG: hypothetical protein RH862_14370 [Leptospiraceae bacterium]
MKDVVRKKQTSHSKWQGLNIQLFAWLDEKQNTEMAGAYLEQSEQFPASLDSFISIRVWFVRIKAISIEQ